MCGAGGLPYGCHKLDGDDGMKIEDYECAKSDCDFVEIWPSYDEQRCKHHSLPEEDREIKTKEIPHWCPLKNEQGK